MAPFNSVALWCSVPVALVGFIFMAKCKVVFVEAFSLPAFKGVGAAPEVGGLLTHFAFILGMVAWCGFGMTSLALALGLPPAAAITPGFTGLVSVLAYMAAVGSGITGVPGITGPPMPARVINGAIAIVLNVNVVCLVAEGDVSGGALGALAAVYALAVGVPHALGAKHRSAGWMAVNIVPAVEENRRVSLD